MKRTTILKQGRQMAIAACSLMIGASALHSCKDDDHVALTGQPDWLGNSIYEQLQESGNYTNMLRLIDDLGQTDVLKQTGSKTIFPADDEAFNQWYSSNQWGIRSYDQLSPARKKLMLKNAMIDNAYLINLMSNVNGNPPQEGKAMRRLTSTSPYDSVYMMPVEKMPQTKYWKELRDAGKPVPMFLSTQAAPMIHFLPAFMKSNKITDSDLAILTNHESNSVNDAWINGKMPFPKPRSLHRRPKPLRKILHDRLRAAPVAGVMVHQYAACLVGGNRFCHLHAADLQRADVVDDLDAFVKSSLRDFRLARVYAHHNLWKLCGKGPHHRHDPPELLLRSDRHVPGARRFAADIYDVSPLLKHHACMAERIVWGKKPVPVRKRIWRDIQYPHDFGDSAEFNRLEFRNIQLHHIFKKPFT